LLTSSSAMEAVQQSRAKKPRSLDRGEVARQARLGPNGNQPRPVTQRISSSVISKHFRIAPRTRPRPWCTLTLWRTAWIAVAGGCLWGWRKPMAGIGRRQALRVFGGAAAWPVAARAQQGGRKRHIGVLMPYTKDDPEDQRRVTALREGLAQLGWTDDHIRIELRWYAGDAGRARAMATELINLQPDVLIAQLMGGSDTRPPRILKYQIRARGHEAAWCKDQRRVPASRAPSAQSPCFNRYISKASFPVQRAKAARSPPARRLSLT
jgi:hypothetical protein